MAPPTDTGGGVLVRLAEPADGPFLEEMDRVATDASPGFKARLHRPAWDAHARAFWSDPRSWLGRSWVAWAGPRRVGALSLSRHDPDGTGADTRRLGMGVIAPFRRRGVGTALLDAAREDCQRAGHPWLALYVDARNRPARRLYLRFGFTDHRLIQGIWEMRLALDPTPDPDPEP